MKNKLFRNVFFNYIYEIFIIIIPLITTPYISRVLRAEGVGIYSYTTSLVTYFCTFSVLGLAGYGLREIAFYRDDKRKTSQLFWEIYLIKVVITVFFIIGWLVFCNFYHEYTPYMIAITPLLIANIFDISWFFKGLEKFNYPVLVNVLAKALSMICIFVFVKNSTDLTKYILIIALSTFFGNVFMWFFLPKNISKTKIDIRSFPKHLKHSFVYFLPSLALVVYSVLDKTLIGLITRDFVQNGYYEQAHKIVNMLLVLCCGALNGVLNSRFSYLYGSGVTQNEIKRRLIQGLNLSLSLSIGCMFGIIAVSKTFVPLFFGEDFTNSIPLFLIFSPLPFICSFSNCLSSNYYTPSGRRKESSFYYMLAALTNLVLNLALIPFFGAIGAALSTIVSEFIISLVLILRSKGILTIKECLKIISKKMIAGLFMFAVVFFVSNYIETSSIRTLFCLVVVGASLYFIILGILNDDSFGVIVEMRKKKTNTSNKERE